MKKGDRFKFHEMDSDTWEYDGVSLIFDVDDPEKTMEITVGEGVNPSITIVWPDATVTEVEDEHDFFLV